MPTLTTTANPGSAVWSDYVLADADILTARPVGAIVWDGASGDLYRSTNAAVATYTQLTGSGTDTTAIHVDVAGEIAGIALKAAPVGADLLVVEDSAAANVKKRITLSALPSPVSVTVTETAADPYAVTASDGVVLLTGTAQVVNLPAGSAGRQVVLKDKAGTATASPITVNPNGAETIDGAGVLSLDSNYVSVTLVFSGTEWSLL